MALPPTPQSTPLASWLGGAMLALDVSTLLAVTGQVLGVSGFFHSSLSTRSHTTSPTEPRPFSPARPFTLGLLLGGGALAFVQLPSLPQPASAQGSTPHSLLPSLLSGLLVGMGTRLANGCTSGHFIAGISRLSPRSIVATATFFSVAMLVSTGHPLVASTAEVASMFRSSAAASLEWNKVLALQLPAVGYLGLIAWARARRHRESRVYNAVVFLTGVHFAAALGLAGMLDAAKVRSFLTLPLSLLGYPIDPSLFFVALGALPLCSFVWFRFVRPRISAQRGRTDAKDSQASQPAFARVAPTWKVPKRVTFSAALNDRRLVGGATLFGLGWGMAGICPGPALVSLTLTLAQSTLAVLAGRNANPSQWWGVGSLIGFVVAMGAGGKVAGLVA